MARHRRIEGKQEQVDQRLASLLASAPRHAERQRTAGPSVPYGKGAAPAGVRIGSVVGGPVDSGGSVQIESQGRAARSRRDELHGGIDDGIDGGIHGGIDGEVSVGEGEDDGDWDPWTGVGPPRPARPPRVLVAADDPATPGRRHPGDGVLGQLVGSVSGRFERPQLVVVAAIVAVGLLLAGWAVLRARPVAIASPAAAGSAESGAPASGPAAPTTTASPPAPSGPSVTATAAGQATASTAVTPGGGSPSATIEVHVLGAVRRPGVVALPAGARVDDAVREAGGLKTSAHLGALNLAQPLGDGQQVYIARGGRTSEVRDPTAPVVAPPAGGSTDGGVGAGGGPASAPPQGPVNLNSASLEQLDQLPGIGPVTAQKILDWRQQNGRFSAVEELQEVDGIGPKTFADLQPLVTV